MERYTAYFLGPDGRVANRIDLVCEHEREAKERARQLAQDCAVELWQGDRRVAEYREPSNS